MPILLTLNLFLIPEWAQNGAAISSVITELVVTIIIMIRGARILQIKYFSNNNTMVFFASLIIAILCYTLNLIVNNDIIKLFFLHHFFCFSECRRRNSKLLLEAFSKILGRAKAEHVGNVRNVIFGVVGEHGGGFF